MLAEYKKIFLKTGGGRRYILLIVLRSPVGMAMTFMNALFLGQAFDAVALNDGNRLNAACIVFAVLNLCVFLYNGAVWSMYAAPFTVRAEGGMRLKLFAHISSLPYEYVETVPEGEWLTRLNTDVRAPFTEHWPHTAGAAVNILVSACFLFFINPLVPGLVLSFVIPHIVFTRFAVARPMPALNKKALEATGKNTGDLNALIACADVAALYDCGAFFMERFALSSKKLFDANMKMRFKNALSAGILPLFGISGYLTLLIACAGRIAAGNLTFGDLTAAFQYRGGVLLGSLTLINCLVGLRADLAGVRRLNETMAEEPEEAVDTR